MNETPLRIRQPLPSARALWAILWRAVVLMPVMAFWMAVQMGMLPASAVLLMNALLFAWCGSWTLATLNLAGSALLAAAVWQWFRRAAKSPPSSSRNDGGYLL